MDPNAAQARPSILQLIFWYQAQTVGKKGGLALTYLNHICIYFGELPYLKDSIKKFE